MRKWMIYKDGHNVGQANSTYDVIKHIEKLANQLAKGIEVKPDYIKYVNGHTTYTAHREELK